MAVQLDVDPTPNRNLRRCGHKISNEQLDIVHNGAAPIWAPDYAALAELLAVCDVATNFRIRDLVAQNRATRRPVTI